MDAHILLEKLDKVRPSGADSWMACCPAHDDKTPSLQIKQANDRVLIHCHAGCGAIDVLEAVGLDWSVLYPEDQNQDYVRPAYKKPVLEEQFFVEIYKSMIRRGQTPIDSDTDRYRQILNKNFGHMA
jgi:hypothetical protein